MAGVIRRIRRTRPRNIRRVSVPRLIGAGIVCVETTNGGFEWNGFELVSQVGELGGISLVTVVEQQRRSPDPGTSE